MSNIKKFDLEEARLLDKNELFGYESKNDFVHLTDAEIFNKLN